jgi:hypothetical protein
MCVREIQKIKMTRFRARSEGEVWLAATVFAVGDPENSCRKPDQKRPEKLSDRMEMYTQSI